MLIDTHCHLTYPELKEQLSDVLARARSAGMERCITVATNPADAAAALQLAAESPGVHVAAGIHPHEAGKATDECLVALRELHASAAPLLAVGETGLDFHYDFAPRDRQEEVFRAQLALACDVQRPVIIHARNAEWEVCDILADYPRLRDRVVFHCFSGDLKLARRVLDDGHWLSFTGVVTFRNADEIRAAATYVPPDRFMVETDAPYLSPEPVRKIRPCEPAFVAHTARRLSELRGVDFDEFCRQTTANAVRFFGIPDRR